MGAQTSCRPEDGASKDQSQALQELLREAVLCERLASGTEACGRYLAQRLRSKLPEAARARQLTAWRAACVSADACRSADDLPNLSHELRQLRKELSGLAVCKSKSFLLDPRFNIEEIRKNAVLFDDHLSEESKVCPECLNKHALLMEAFLDEGLSLDAGQQRWRSFLLALRPSVFDLRRRIAREGNDVAGLRRAIRRITDSLDRAAAAGL